MTLPEPTMSELASAAHSVVESIDGLRTEIKSAQKYGRRNRALIWAVAGSVILDFILSIALIALFQRTNDTAREARAASSAQVVSCRAANETRRLQTELWNTILAFPPPPGELPAAAVIREQRTAEFRVYIQDAFAQQDCERLVLGAKQ